MNITGYKWKLGKAKNMIKDLKRDLDRELNKRRRNYNLIDSLRERIKEIRAGMRITKNKIKKLRDERKRKKK